MPSAKSAEGEVGVCQTAKFLSSGPFGTKTLTHSREHGCVEIVHFKDRECIVQSGSETSLDLVMLHLPYRPTRV
jgi:hypothetical protein